MADRWQPFGSSNDAIFYYTDDLEAGESSNILVKNVQLDKGVSQNNFLVNFLAFDFDLNVNLESIQVTKNAAGLETVEPIGRWDAETAIFAGANGATPIATDADDLALVKWQQ